MNSVCSKCGDPLWVREHTTKAVAAGAGHPFSAPGTPLVVKYPAELEDRISPLVVVGYALGIIAVWVFVAISFASI